MNEAPFDPEQFQKYIDEINENVAVQAHVDQQSTALDRMRDNGTWWACLCMLGQERGNEVATAIATQHLKQWLADQPQEMLVILAAYLLHNTISLVAKHYEDGDNVAAIAHIVGPRDFLNLEKFVATSGQSCPDCGYDNGWEEHNCPPEEADDEPFQG